MFPLKISFFSNHIFIKDLKLGYKDYSILSSNTSVISVGLKDCNLLKVRQNPDAHINSQESAPQTGLYLPHIQVCTSLKFILASISQLFKIINFSRVQKPHVKFQKMYTGSSVRGSFAYSLQVIQHVIHFRPQGSIPMA